MIDLRSIASAVANCKQSPPPFCNTYLVYLYTIYYESVISIFYLYDPVTVAIGPDPPSAVTAVPGASLGSIRVTWVAPADTGGLTIAAYFIQYRIRGSASYVTQLSQSQPTEATITGLRLGTTYQLRLATVTALGIGPYCCRLKGSEVFARTLDGKQIVQACNTDANHIVYLFVHNY